MGVAEGTVYLYAKRVCHVLRNIHTKHLFWPGPARRQFLKDAMEEFGFPGCIGIVDGTLIHLVDKLLKNGWAYYSRKQFYAVSGTETKCFVPDQPGAIVARTGCC